MSTEVYLAIYDLSMGTAQQLSSMFLGPEKSISMVPHTGIVAFNNEYFFSSSGVQHQNPSTFRLTSGIQPIEVKLIGRTNKSKLEFENWLYYGTDVPRRFHGTTYKLLEHNCNTFSNYVLRDIFGFNVGVPDYVLDVPRKVMSSPLGSMLASSMENMQPFGNTNSTMNSTAPSAQTRPSGFTTTTTNPPVPPSWQHNSSVNKSETDKMKVLSNTIKNTPMLDSHNTLLLSKDSSSFVACVKKLCQSNLVSEKQKHALEMLQTNFTNSKLSSIITSDVIFEAIGPFFSLDKKEDAAVIIENESDILYSLMVLRVLLLQHNNSYDLSPFIQHIMKMLISSSNNNNLKEITRSMSWCTLSNAFCNPNHYKYIVSSKLLDDLTDASLQDIIIIPTTSNNKNIISLKQSSSTFLYNLVHVTSFKQPQDDINNECILPDWCVNVVCNISQELENEVDVVTETRRIVILGKIMQKSILGKELVKDIGLLYDISLENLNFEKNKLLVKEVVNTCSD